MFNVNVILLFSGHNRGWPPVLYVGASYFHILMDCRYRDKKTARTTIPVPYSKFKMIYLFLKNKHLCFLEAE